MAGKTETPEINAPRLLQNITCPADLHQLSIADLSVLAAEIRVELLEAVARCGGHLASNLGVVELTIALLHIFDADRDCVIWDTGHQGYVYKLLTGRRELLQNLRQDDGCCGFLHRKESNYDLFGAGHAGTAISAALGFAAARDRKGEVEKRVIAVVGDGAFGSGISLEGLNSVIETTDDFILILNDNKMSIAPNVGAISRYLNRLISAEGYNRFKKFLANSISQIPGIGPKLRSGIGRLEEATKSILVPGVIFEELGLRYIGPLDGHDIEQLTDTFRRLKQLRQPLVVHVLTQKGHGYPRAEQAPEIYHGMSPFNIDSGEPEQIAADDSFSSTFGSALENELAAQENVVAITAGMCYGTGMHRIRERFQDRYFDVGIAEEHAVVFAAGLAADGFRPVLAIYASFMHRAVDYVFHDVCLQDLPVVFCLDRAGIVADGPTHHGIHDFSFWRGLPNMTVLQPADAYDLQQMLHYSLQQAHPVIIRYPRAKSTAVKAVNERTAFVPGQAEILRPGSDCAIWAVGSECSLALAMAEKLQAGGISATIVNPRSIMPFDQTLLQKQIEADMPLITLEDHVMEGGFSSIIREAAAAYGFKKILCRGWPREVLPWGTVAGIRKKYGLDAASLMTDISNFVRTKPL